MRKRRRKPFQRYFTVAEANALVPDLSIKLLRLQAMLRRLREEYGEKETELFQRAQTNGKHPEWEASEIAPEIHKAVDELHSMGVLLRDIEQGIVDFPHLRDGARGVAVLAAGREARAVLSRAGHGLPRAQAALGG
jgi:hypothetical protein